MSQLDEVVVTGYQQIEKRKVTSAITTVQADDIKSIGVASIDQMLEGQVAGFVVDTGRTVRPELPLKCGSGVRFSVGEYRSVVGTRRYDPGRKRYTQGFWR